MSTNDRPKDRYGRIAIPVAGPNEPGNPGRQLMRLELIGGRRADTDPTVAPLSDVNNFVMLPDGSGMRVRDGFEFTNHYAIQTDPPGRIALMIETAPANVSVSYRHMALLTGAGLPYILDGEYIRDRSQSISEQSANFVTLQFGAIQVEAQDPIATANINAYRSGDFDVSTTINYATRDGTATVAGLDYIAESGSFTFNPGDVFELIIGVSVLYNPSIFGKYFYLDIFTDSQVTKIGEFKTTLIELIAP